MHFRYPMDLKGFRCLYFFYNSVKIQVLPSLRNQWILHDLVHNIFLKLLLSKRIGILHVRERYHGIKRDPFLRI